MANCIFFLIYNPKTGKLKFEIKIKRSKYKLKNKFYQKQLLDMSCQWKNEINLFKINSVNAEWCSIQSCINCKSLLMNIKNTENS
ncbi:hypothetical protein BpHYR1_049868 [Brachionus plicatilis]|uniref:Uncharacterized protein n=1 Tax=Brachionus plicatilis TaxID=10195 RepID=A0A3M7PUW7_BRAPC|nr:hypothetical protein BpHYR1_049868 [Brachionus plicatilis]